MKIIDYKDCCGCSACIHACPKDAIAFQKDERGFLYAEIQEDRCVECGRCKTVCPILNTKAEGEQPPKAYAASSLEASSDKSSSGGIFALIAQKFIERGGVVFGTAMTEDFHVQVIGVTNVEDLIKLQGSKYVQSDMRNAFDQIKQHLDHQIPVLFSGTPCQTSAIKNVFGKRDGLYLIDLVCHGVPNEQMFRDSVAHLQSKYNHQIAQIRFRDKRYGHGVIGSVTLQNGKVKKLPAYRYDYYALFLKNNILTESCYQCPYANPNRIGDLTLCDYWNVHVHERDFYNACNQKGLNGISAVMVHTSKGAELYEAIAGSVFQKETEMRKVQANNPSLATPTKRGADYHTCMKLYQSGSWNAVSRFYYKKYRLKNWKTALYSSLPLFVKNLLKKLR